MRTRVLLFYIFLMTLLTSRFAHADWWWSDAPAPQQVQVAEPYLEWRTGPASGYPIVHVVERGEWLTLLKRKTNWMKVEDEEGRQGWVDIEDILLTREGSGDLVSIVEPRFDDFSTRRWESGLMMGEFDSAAVNAAYLGYWMTEHLSAEIWGSQVLDSKSEIRLASLNLLHQPFPQWRLSPFFTLGVGQVFIKPKSTLVNVADSEDTAMNVGIGLRYYVTDRYFIRGEVKEYKIFTNRETNEEAIEWKIGLSIFF